VAAASKAEAPAVLAAAVVSKVRESRKQAAELAQMVKGLKAATARLTDLPAVVVAAAALVA
jgi:ribosomal protein L22